MLNRCTIMTHLYIGPLSIVSRSHLNYQREIRNLLKTTDKTIKKKTATQGFCGQLCFSASHLVETAINGQWPTILIHFRFCDGHPSPSACRSKLVRTLEASVLNRTMIQRKPQIRLWTGQKDHMFVVKHPTLRTFEIQRLGPAPETNLQSWDLRQGWPLLQPSEIPGPLGLRYKIPSSGLT